MGRQGWCRAGGTDLRGEEKNILVVWELGGQVGDSGERELNSKQRKLLFRKEWFSQISLPNTNAEIFLGVKKTSAKLAFLR